MRRAYCLSKLFKKYYDDCLDFLIRKNLVYACECSRSEILSNQHLNNSELHYSGKCKNKNLSFKGTQ